MAASAGEAEAKLRGVRKKLAQIEKLKEKPVAQLDAAAREKVASEASLRAEVRALEAQLGMHGSHTEEESPNENPKPKAKAKAATATAASPPRSGEEESPQEEAHTMPANLTPEQEKRLKAIKKKLDQIKRLKEKVAEGHKLEPEAQEKVDSEADLLREANALERGEAFVPAPPELVATGTAADLEKRLKTIRKKLEQIKRLKEKVAEGHKLDPEAQEKVASEVDLNREALTIERAQAFEAPPGDLGLLIDDDTEKRFKALQKKLRDILKLHEKAPKEKLDKLQQDKIQQEAGVIEEIAEIRKKATELVDARRAQLTSGRPQKAVSSDPQPRKESGPLPEWQCLECGAFGAKGELEGSEGAAACPTCGGDFLQHNAPGRYVEEDDGDGEDEAEGGNKGGGGASPKKGDADLKTARQKKPPPAVAKKADGGQPSPESARWPELKEVLESGEKGVDKSRQRKAVQVDRKKGGPPYDAFDPVLLKCNFLTRVELKLPPGVLAGENFQLYFPGALSDGLLELILKENELPTVPPGIQQLQRIRSIDLSHNRIASLPDPGTWESVSGSLELLDLSFNKLTSIAELAPLRKLSQLKVDANQLTALDGLSWGELKQLATLSAVGNQITAIPEAVEQTASLEYVELSDNKIVSVPVGICELKKLKSLNIAGNPIKDQKVVKAAEKGLKDLKAYLSKVGQGGGKK